jgi:hypothetical protein
MTHYLLAVHSDADRPELAGDALQQAYIDVEAFNERMRQAGAYVYAGGLAPPDDAQIVDNTGSNAETKIGSYIAGPRRLGGFWVLDAPDDVTAHKYAMEASKACQSPVEVRAFQD